MQASQEFQKLAKPMFLTPNILHFALVLSIFIYFFIGYMITKQGGPPAPVEFGIMRNILIGISVLLIAGTTALRLHLFGRERLERTLKELFLKLKEGTLPDLPTFNQDIQKRVKALPLKEQAVRRMFPLAFTPFILILALNEAIAIFGLVLALLSRDLMEMVPFAAAAIFLDLTMIGFINRIVNTSLEIVNERRFDFE